MGSGYYPPPDREMEHIMANNFSDEWKKYIITNVTNVKTDTDAKEYHKKFVNTIGNLTFINQPLNASISDDLYDKKLVDYNKELHPITNSLGKYYPKDWRDKEIIDRSKKIMERVLEILDINNLDTSSLPSFSYSTVTPAAWYDLSRLN